ncbi:MAG TPA: Ig-like domain-containing protein [Terriglobales bacterium]|nr:Ig-like domain-containing protein [Terriglobales bacterium]
MQRFARTVIVTAALAVSAFAQIPVNLKPTTTVAVETQNNTSASGTYSNPSVGTTLGNLSKLPLAQLLPGFHGKIYASVVLFWGSSKHINVGYNAADPAQVDRQIEDIISRGMSGAILDWYGGGSYQETAAEVWRQEVTKYPGFEFAIQEDQNSHTLKACSTSSCAQNALISDLNFIASHYFGSSQYIRINGRPLLPTFDVDWYYPDPSATLYASNAIFIDWAAVRASISGNPLILERGPLGVTESSLMSDGAYSWIGINKLDPADEDLNYIVWFDKTALSMPGRIAIGSVYKGFNDGAASWSQHRIVDQHCGKLWLDTFRTAVKTLGSQIDHLDAFQVTTWNDYEEATTLETGVDNCLSVTASLTGTRFKWAISPNTAASNATLSMFVVYVSTDGKNLAQLQVLPTNARSLDLTQYALPAGNYELFVKARGQPSVFNHLSGAVTFPVYSTLKVTSPTSNAVVSSPVAFQASAASSAGVKVITLNIDGRAVYKSNTSVLSTALPLAAGVHKYLYVVKDSSGRYTKEGGSITVK